jgi:superfamily II DNA or RNA helicase
VALRLFEHNEKAYHAAVRMMEQYGKAAIVHPTGTGKSYIAFKLIEDNPEKVVIWLSPSEYIFKTQLESLKKNDPDFPLANVHFYTYAKLMCCTQAQLDDIAAQKPAYIILDEFHRAGAECWGESTVALLKLCPEAKLLGLTATNIRYLDNNRDMAEELFDGRVASDMTLGEAIVRGILPTPNYVTTVYQYQKDLARYQTRVDNLRSAGIQDVNQKYLDALRRALEQADGLDKVFEHHITNKSGKYIVFCANKEHMDEMISHVPEWFAKVNAEVAVYEAYSDDPGTDKAFADFKTDESDKLKLLFCIDMLNEGVHVEGISGVILFRPTISPTIYKQQIGRALTAGENSTPLILDVVNNFEGLCSIAGLQGEMQEAVYRLNANGEGDRIITERFEVIEQVHDCRVLFEQLQASLSSSWDHYFSEASIYYAEHGNLNIPKRYTTPAGLSLGEWLTTQRRVRAGQIPGNLTEQQIARLDSIGMKWGNRNDAAWEHGLEEARKFREQFGNLQVPAKYKTKNDYPLGKWINNARKRRSDGKLTEERIRQLDQMGMIWSVFDAKWEQGYALAMNYAAKHGDLNVPVNYTTEEGKKLGAWILNQRTAYAKEMLSQDQIGRLEKIGIYWGNRNDRQWNEVYGAAKRYFEANGDLDVPVAYVSPEGYALGKWVRRQQYAYRNPEKSNAILSQERIELLDDVGMQWEKPDSWQHRYELAQEYKKQYGNLEIPAKYKTADGIWLSRWVYNQKRLLQSGSKKLSEEQKKKLKELLGYYVKISA